MERRKGQSSDFNGYIIQEKPTHSEPIQTPFIILCAHRHASSLFDKKIWVQILLEL